MTWANEWVAKAAERNGGNLPAFAWPGGYPMYYLTDGGAVLCPDCANGEEARANEAGWRVEGCGVHREGDPLDCDGCGEEIESAHGDPEDDS